MEAIEGHTARPAWRRPHPVAARLRLARGWYQAGFPLATVLVGMDRAFERTLRVGSLAYCRRFVEELAAAGPLPPPRPRRRRRGAPARAGGGAGALRDRLKAFGPPPNACFGPPLRRIQEIEDLLAVAFAPTELRAGQAAGDRRRGIARRAAGAGVGRGARGAPGRRRRGPSSATAARVDDAALRDAHAHRFTLQRARERLGLPRVSLV